MKNKINKVFIIGSKPDILYPEGIVPDVVVGANVAVQRIQKYKNEATLYGVVSNYIFTKRDKVCTVDYNEIKESYVDTLFVTALKTVTEESKYNLSQTTFNQNNIIYLNEKILNKCKNKYISNKFILKNYGLKGLFKYYLYNLKGKKNRFTHISTGMLSLAIMLEQYKNIKMDIYLLGIGIDPNSGHFYDKNIIMSDYHLEKDKEFIKNVVKFNNLINVYATDPLLKKYIESHK
ncbi:hypothetical protein [Arcobacter sp. 15-2]|uniref:hypothetical protein n=1 Tax=Arcobacter sp. 15-2 TaxID=3374109 RepID=UPI00399C8D1D